MFRKLAFAVVLVICGLLAGMVIAGRMRSATDAAALPDAPVTQARPASTAPAPQSAVGSAPDFADVAARTIPAVANIASLQVTRTPNSPFGNDPFFRFFFGDDPDLFGQSERRGQSAGSGVVVSADGYVLTNNHVVGEYMREITVVLADKRERAAKLIGVDPLTDLAVLKIDVRDLPTIPWGDSSRLRVADWVLAIGNPYQLNQTVTLGIVSALGRTNITGGYEDFIQTDAAINPGNSGGALINRRGELIGINTAIFSQTGGYQGIGFAIPSNLARRVMADIVKFGEVRRGSIGTVQTVQVTPEYAQELGLRQARGALVWRMSRASAAYQAGIRPGDVIDRFNGQTVDDPNQFLRFLADTPIGTTVTLTIIRAGRELDVKVPVEKTDTERRPRA
jgi:Do/DeqQ family serine protease